MSWDVLLMKIRGTPPAIEDMSDEFVEPLGEAETVRRQISEVLAGVDWSDPGWGQYEGQGFSIEFNAGKDDAIDAIMLHVRGGGDPVGTIMAIARPLGWSALDISTGAFLDPDNPSDAGWSSFQGYRDAVIGE